MKPIEGHKLRLLKSGAALAILLALIMGYRDLISSRQPLNAVPFSLARASIHLENAPFTSLAHGNINWTLHASSMDIYGIPGMALNNGLQQAVIHGLKDGKIYPVPSINKPISSVPSAITPRSQATLTFSADNASYLAGQLAKVPLNLQLTFLVQWQFQLNGNVEIHLHSGEEMQTQSASILQLTDRRTGTNEQRMIGDEGADVTYKNLTLHLNSFRYTPSSRAVDGANGVTVTYRKGDETSSLSTDRAYWSLKDRIMRCPDTASGVWKGIHISASNFYYNSSTNSLYGLGKAEIRIPSPLIPDHGKLLIPPAKADDKQKVHDVTVDFKGTWRTVGNSDAMVGHNFIYRDKDVVITGDYIYANRSTGIYKADGHLIYDSLQYHAVCDKVRMDKKKNFQLFEGNVVMQIKPETAAQPSATVAAQPVKIQKQSEKDTFRQHGMTVYCDRVFRNTEIDVSTIPGPLKATQKFLDDKGKEVIRSLTAASAIYDGKLEQITLQPPISFTDNRGNEGKTENPIVIGTRKGEESIRGDTGHVRFPANKSPVSEESNPGKRAQPDTIKAPPKGK